MTDRASNIRHTEDKIDSTHMTHHIISSSVYMIVFAILLFLTAATVAVAYIDMGSIWNLVAALGIATAKATFVVMWFMHVKYSGKLIRIVIATSIMFLALMIFGTLMDVWTRNNVTPAGELEQYEYNKTSLVDTIAGSDKLDH